VFSDLALPDISFLLVIPPSFFHALTVLWCPFFTEVGTVLVSFFLIAFSFRSIFLSLSFPLEWPSGQVSFGVSKTSTVFSVFFFSSISFFFSLSFFGSSYTAGFSTHFILIPSNYFLQAKFGQRVGVFPPRFGPTPLVFSLECFFFFVLLEFSFKVYRIRTC